MNAETRALIEKAKADCAKATARIQTIEQLHDRIAELEAELARVREAFRDVQQAEL